MTKERLIQLITRHLYGQPSVQETVELKDWVNEDEANRELLSRIASEEDLEREIRQYTQIDPAKGYGKWVYYMAGQRKARIRQIVGWTAAAAILIAVVVAGLTRKPIQSKEITPA